VDEKTGGRGEARREITRKSPKKEHTSFTRRGGRETHQLLTAFGRLFVARDGEDLTQATSFSSHWETIRSRKDRCVDKAC
jgi:hypothetical protein